jgi:hypothetical protein
METQEPNIIVFFFTACLLLGGARNRFPFPAMLPDPKRRVPDTEGLSSESEI